MTAADYQRLALVLARLAQSWYRMQCDAKPQDATANAERTDVMTQSAKAQQEAA